MVKLTEKIRVNLKKNSIISTTMDRELWQSGVRTRLNAVGNRNVVYHHVIFTIHILIVTTRTGGTMAVAKFTSVWFYCVYYYSDLVLYVTTIKEIDIIGIRVCNRCIGNHLYFQPWNFGTSARCPRATD